MPVAVSQWPWPPALAAAQPATPQPSREPRAQPGGPGSPGGQLQLPTPPAQGCLSCSWTRRPAWRCSWLFGSLPRRWHPWLAQPGSPLGAGCSGCSCSPDTLQLATPALHLPSRARASVPRRMLLHSSQAGSCPLPRASTSLCTSPSRRVGFRCPHTTPCTAPFPCFALWSHPATTSRGCSGASPPGCSAPAGVWVLQQPPCHRVCPLAAAVPGGCRRAPGRARLRRCPCASSRAMPQKPPCQNPAEIRRGERC